MQDASLCYIFSNGKVLLQKKSQGKFGEGKWSAPGGKIEKGEPPEKAAVREVGEETGLKVKGLQKIGILNFVEKGGGSFLVHVFVTDKFSGTMKESKEGRLEWFDAGCVPYDEMWEDDILWFPHLLKKEKFTGAFLFAKGFKNLISHNVQKAEGL